MELKKLICTPGANDDDSLDGRMLALYLLLVPALSSTCTGTFKCNCILIIY